MQAAGSDAIIAIEPERIVYALELAEAPHAANGHAILPTAPPLGATEAAPGAAVHAGRRSRAGRAERRLPARLPRRRDAPHRRPRRRRRRRRGSARRRPRARRDAGHLGAPGDQGRQLLPHRREDPRRGARHRLRPPAPGLRRPHDQVASRSCPARRCRTATATARTASARRSGASARRRAARATASRTSARSTPARCSPTPGSGSDTGILAGIEWAIAEQVRRRLDVARRADAAGPAVLPGLRARRAARAGQGHADRGRGRQRLEPARAHPPGLAPGELPLDHGRRGARPERSRSPRSPTAGSTRTAGRSTSRRPA